MQPVFIIRHSSISADGTLTGQTMPAVEPDYKEIITDATLRRRMSRFVKMGVACGLECIGQTPSAEIDAVITATGLGCLGDTEKFLDSILVNNERLLNPTPFIQSTFNTVGGQLALLKGIHSYNVTYVHRGLSFESALIDGMLQVADGARNVLLGAIDEITAASADVQRRMGLLRNYPLGEGSQFFMLSGKAEKAPSICDVETHTSLTDSEFADIIESFTQRNNLKSGDVDCVLSGSSVSEKLFGGKSINFKAQCGEYQTATAFALCSAAQMIEEGKAANVLIANQYQKNNSSLILVRK